MTASAASKTRVLHQLCSLLLAYPEPRIAREAGLLRRAAASLPEALQRHLLPLLDSLEAPDLLDLEAAYVATFDLRRNCSLYLTYATHGDTRERGAALLRFKDAYRAAGMVPADDELPDYLPVVLEFSAAGDHGAGMALLEEHRPSIELLRLALGDPPTPWRGVLDALSTTLRPLTAAEQATVGTLAREGPPRERVGTARDDLLAGAGPAATAGPRDCGAQVRP